MENLSFQYPSWYIILCLLLGLIISGLLYYREVKFREIAPWAKYFLAISRFLATSALAMLLLSPLLKSIMQETKDPQIVILEDQSLSITEGTGTEKLQQFKEDLDNLVTSFESKHHIDHYYFGDEVIVRGDTLPEAFKVSNISEALQYAYDMYNDQNLGAVILVSDGLYNEGRNPIYQNLQFKAPVFSVGIGDTTTKRDLLIKQIFYNKISYLGDKFTVQVDVQALNSANSRTQLSYFEEVNDEFQRLGSEVINIQNRDFFVTLPIDLEAQKPGLVRYRFQLDPISNEMTRGNNFQDIYVEILDSKLLIALVANAPHPDIASLKKNLEKNKNYELSVYSPDDEELRSDEFDFVIFHDLPSAENSIGNFVDRLNSSKTPRMYIVGAQTNLSAFNEIQNTVEIAGNNFQTNEVQAIPNNNFNLFNLNEKTRDNVPNFVPLLAPFGEYSIGPSTHILYFQKIGTVGTPYPLVSFSQQSGIKTAIISAEGIWKWQLFDYLQNDNNEIFDDFISQAITYTTVKEDKRKFRVSSLKNLYKENEHIAFSAELYNNSYQLINEPDVYLSLTNSRGENFDYIFSKRNKIYELNAGLLPEGTYRFDARVQYRGEQYNQSGRLSVQAIQLEMFNLKADHQLLSLLSDKHGGKFTDMDKMDSLSIWLNNASHLKPLVFSSTQTRSVIHIKWLFAMVCLLLIAEWFIRRYFGSY